MSHRQKPIRKPPSCAVDCTPVLNAPIDCTMKSILAIAAVALLTGVARADWKDLKPGMDYRTARTCVGFPLMQNHGRGGAEVWTYDNRGYIQFQNGRVSYWEHPVLPVFASSRMKSVPVAGKPATMVPGQAVALKD
jgi:hypothetical protein